MKAIAQIHNRIRTAISKDTGKYYEPEELDREIHAESMNLFNKYFDRYPATQKEATYLAPFIKIEKLSYNTNLQGFPKPEGWLHPILLSTADEKYNLHLTEHGHWTNKANDPLTGPALDHPLVRIDPDKLVVLPAEITEIKVHYLTSPATPMWAYTFTDGQYVYQDENSKDMGWDEVVNDQIINRVLTNLGIAQREPEVVQYGMANQQTEEL